MGTQYGEHAELTLHCQQCGDPFTYVKLSGPKRAYCSQRCRYAASVANAVACVRGLLCHCCNLMLGNARDSITRLDQAKRYLIERQQFSLSVRVV